MRKFLLVAILAVFSFGANADDSQSLTSSLWNDLMQQIRSVTGYGDTPTGNVVRDEQETDSVSGNGGRPEDTRSVTGNGG